VDLLGADPQIRRRSSLRPEAWQAIRVEAGIAVMGAELDGVTIAAEAGLLEPLRELSPRAGYTARSSWPGSMPAATKWPAGCEPS